MEEKKLASAEELKGKQKDGRRNGEKKSFLPKAILVLAALALAAGIFIFSGQVQPATEETPAPTATAAADERVRLIERSRAEVAEVTVAHGDRQYTIVSGDAGTEGGESTRHTLKERPAFDLDQEKAAAILGCAANLTATRQVAENAEDLAAWGLETPLARVTMRYRDGSETVWRIGDRAPTSTASYFMREDTKAVYLLYASAVDTLSAERNDLHTLSMPGTVASGRIRTLLIEGEGRSPVEVGYSEEGAEDKAYSISALRIRQPFYHTANAERTLELFEKAAGVTITSFAGELDELRDTGLEEGKSRFRMTVTQTKDGDDSAGTETFVFRVGNRTEDGAWTYLMVDETDSVYLTAASSVSFLEEATPAYLVDQFANLIYISAVRGLEITAGEESWHLEIEHPEEGNDVYRFGGQEVTDLSAFRKLYQQIVGMTSSKLSEDYEYDGEAVLSVRYDLNVDPGELLVEYLFYNEDYCAVRREGLTLFLIKREQVEALRSALQDFAEQMGKN